MALLWKRAAVEHSWRAVKCNRDPCCPEYGKGQPVCNHAVFRSVVHGTEPSTLSPTDLRKFRGSARKGLGTGLGTMRTTDPPQETPE